MRTILATAALLSTLIATPALAQERCAPLAQVEAMLAKEFHEARVQQGIMGEGEAMLMIYASPNGETWSAVVVRPDGVGCLASAGTDWATRNPAPAVPEQGS